MPKIYKLQKLNPNGRMWRYYPHNEDHAYWVGEDEATARQNAARGSSPRNKALSMSPWLDPEQTSCVLDYDSSLDGVSGVENQNDASDRWHLIQYREKTMEIDELPTLLAKK